MVIHAVHKVLAAGRKQAYILICITSGQRPRQPANPKQGGTRERMRLWRSNQADSPQHIKNTATGGD